VIPLGAELVIASEPASAGRSGCSRLQDDCAELQFVLVGDSYQQASDWTDTSGVLEIKASSSLVSGLFPFRLPYPK
jgi:hypothetical protein